jgi:hypothetical protein
MPTTGVATHLDWETIYSKFPVQMSQLEEFLGLYESQFGITIAPGAVEIVIIPLVEDLQEGEDIDFSELGPTVEKLFSSMSEHPHEVDEGRYRSSRSALKAMFENWCGIPPICRRRKRGEQPGVVRGQA